MTRDEPHYFTIQDADGSYFGVYSTREEAAHARRVTFGIRATARAIVRVAGTPRDDHSASRRVDVLEREAPHLLAYDLTAGRPPAPLEPGNHDA